MHFRPQYTFQEVRWSENRLFEETKVLRITAGTNFVFRQFVAIRWSSFRCRPYIPRLMHSSQAERIMKVGQGSTGMRRKAVSAQIGKLKPSPTLPRSGLYPHLTLDSDTWLVSGKADDQQQLYHRSFPACHGVVICLCVPSAAHHLARSPTGRACGPRPLSRHHLPLLQLTPKQGVSSTAPTHPHPPARPPPPTHI